MHLCDRFADACCRRCLRELGVGVGLRFEGPTIKLFSAVKFYRVLRACCLTDALKLKVGNAFSQQQEPAEADYHVAQAEANVSFV